MPDITRKSVIERLRAAGIQPSGPRIAVYEYLCRHLCHPSVDAIFQGLTAEHPTLSLTTVYNTVKLLEEKNLILSLDSSDGKAHYDATTSYHAHFQCIACHRIIDIPMAPPQEMPVIPNAVIRYSSQTFYGLCPDCAATQNGLSDN